MKLTYAHNQFSGWPSARLADVCQRLTSGGTPSRRNSAYYTGSGGVPWVKTQEIADSVIYETSEHITETALSESSAKLLPAGTLLMAMYAAPTAGRLAILGREMSCNQAACAITCDESLLDTRFLFYQLLASRADIHTLANGAAQQNLSVRMIKDLEIALPPLDEQRRIAGVLGALDDLADENLRQVERIHALSQTLYESFAARSSTKVKLGAVAQTNPDKVKPETEGSISYVDIASLSDGNMVSQATTWDQAPSRARRGAMVGDTLWSTVRPNRRGHAVLTKHIESLVVSTGIAVLRPHLVGPAELFAATDRQGFVDYLVSRAEGSAYPAVSASAFHEAEIADLAAVDREMFESAMWPLWRWVGELEHESHHLRRTRDELLPLLLSGRVRVGEVAA